MNKKIMKAKYLAQDLSRIVLNDCMSAFMGLLWLSTPPYLTKAFYLYMEDGYGNNSVRNKLNRLHKNGFIRKVGKGKKTVIEFKKEPNDFIYSQQEKLKMYKYSQKWDGLWRFLVYDIPEKKRTKRNDLRAFVRSLGFGKVKDSCWVSPYGFFSEIYKYCKNEKLLQYICLYEGNFFSGKDINEMVEEIWGLNAMDEEYREMIGICKENIRFVETHDSGGKEYFGRYLEVYLKYVDLMRRDPFLPDLFVRRWKRKNAEMIFNKLLKMVSREIFSHLFQDGRLKKCNFIGVVRRAEAAPAVAGFIKP